MQQIYAACLAAYNNGILHGEWIDATQDPDSIGHEIQLMLERSPIPGAEEYAIHDYDGFGGLDLGEYESLDDLHGIALALDDFPATVVAHFHGQVDAQDLLETCQGHYIGSVAEESGEVNAYAAYILAEEDHFWEELPQQYRGHMRAIARSEALDRLLNCEVTALYEGAGTWHFVSNY
ncbi:antirestriction protein ArdA [Streptomyces sp. NPDC059928]|uniref:antirestriction protein ArdA n=1 Tax=unclassified Streptomyces TaxID=2593676 RepID=UPI0036475A44